MEAFDTNLLKGNHPTKKNSKFLSLQGDFLRNESTIQLDRKSVPRNQGEEGLFPDQTPIFYSSESG
jgi:hypothetical protein